MKISKEGIELIKEYEGCELKAYRCPADVWTIGYGHTKGVKEGDTCTQEEAETMLGRDLEEFETYIRDLVKPTVGWELKGRARLEQYEFDALVSWVYNLGPTNLKSSTLLQRLIVGDFEDVPNQIRRWNKAGGRILNGLVRRREAEALLFQGKKWK